MSGLRLDDYLPYRLSVAANTVSDLIAGAYKSRFGISVPQWRLIAVLGEGGGMTPQALAARTVMDKVTVSRAAAGLIGRDLLRRTPHGRDRRSHRLSLTAKGLALYEAVAPLALAYETQLLTSFSNEDRAAAHRLLTRLQAAATRLAAAGDEAAAAE
jgi:DNA-binding MarR family transcriptional regulator